MLDHTGDLFDETFREGVVSDGLILGTLLSAALLTMASALAFRSNARHSSRGADG